MKKIVSTIYKNTSIQFSDELVVFENGKAEVKDETWEYIKAGGFHGIALEEEAGKLEKEKTEAEKDTDEALKVLKEEYEFEIARLNGIIKDKNKKIEQLEQSLDVWRKEVERLSNGGQPKEIVEDVVGENTATEEEIASLKEDMSKMTFEDLKALAIENGMSKQKAGRFKEDDQKDELIEAIIALPKK
jgi:hypothetical protein